MTNEHSNELLEVEIGGKLLSAWESSWQRLPGGFKKPHPELRTEVGLMRAVLNGQTMYILRALEYAAGGIEKGLQRIRGAEQTGNEGYGAQMIRERIDNLDLEVLVVGNGATAAQTTKSLKILMIKYHDPEWNRAHARRMRMLRAGKIDK